MYVIVVLRVTEEEKREKRKISVDYRRFFRHNLRAMYWYVQIDIDEDPHVVCVMHVYDDQPMMTRPVPRYHSELHEQFDERKDIFSKRKCLTIITKDCGLKRSLNSRQVCIIEWTLTKERKDQMIVGKRE